MDTIIVGDIFVWELEDSRVMVNWSVPDFRDDITIVIEAKKKTESNDRFKTVATPSSGKGYYILNNLNQGEHYSLRLKAVFNSFESQYTHAVSAYPDYFTINGGYKIKDLHIDQYSVENNTIDARLSWTLPPDILPLISEYKLEIRWLSINGINEGVVSFEEFVLNKNSHSWDFSDDFILGQKDLVTFVLSPVYYEGESDPIPAFLSHHFVNGSPPKLN